jgi:2-amino-4-hydroxy-6-hydroxymethyldihydropteridine diphosphokinase
MSLCLIGLGSNEGDRQAILVGALDELGRGPGIVVLRRSRLAETAPAGGPPGQGRYLNAAAVLQTSLAPDAVLRVLLEVETALGRRRVEPWGPRTVDLDLLLYDDAVLATSTLILPHPRMAWRRFVLEPAAEVAGAMIHPTTGWTIARLLEHLNTAEDYLAITGPVGAGKTEIARGLAQSAGVRWIAETPDAAAPAAVYASSAGNAWSLELEFLDRRSRLLALDSSTWREPASLWVSDFWFDQCLAYARVGLSAEERIAFERRWEEAARGVVRPKLIVMLERDAERLPGRIARRGHRGAPPPTRDMADRLREALQTCLRRPDVGPVLRLVDQPPEEALRELLAAVEAMK